MLLFFRPVARILSQFTSVRTNDRSVWFLSNGNVVYLKMSTATPITKPSKYHFQPSTYRPVAHVLPQITSVRINGRLVWFLFLCQFFNIQYGFRQTASTLTILCVLTRLYEMHYQNINVMCLSLFDFENNFRNQCVMWLTAKVDYSISLF